MSEFHNPYHFVPVEGVTTKGWQGSEPGARLDAGDHSHARYHPDRLSGRIVCRLTAETPLVIGDKQEKPNSNGPTTVTPFELTPGQPALPATSLRGLLSSLAEAASGSALRVLHNRILSFRQGMDNALSALGMLEKDGQGGWQLLPLTLPTLSLKDLYELPAPYGKLFPRPDGSNLKVLLDTVEHRGSVITNDAKAAPFYWMELRKDTAFSGKHLQETPAVRTPSKSANFAISRRAHGPHRILFDARPPHKPGPECEFVRGVLRKLTMRGRDLPNTRQHEVFIPFPEAVSKRKRFSIPPEVIAKFERLALERSKSRQWDKNAFAELLPYHPADTRSPAERNPDSPELCLRHGDIVFFKAEGNGADAQIVEISFSAIWRDWVAQDAARCKPATVHDFFSHASPVGPELLPFHPQRRYVSPAEWLFGFVEHHEKTDRAASSQPSRAFAGKVRVSYGLLAHPDPSRSWYHPPVTLKLMGSPKPPSPSLYFKPASWQGGAESTASDDSAPAQPTPGKKKTVRSLAALGALTAGLNLRKYQGPAPDLSSGEPGVSDGSHIGKPDLKLGRCTPQGRKFYLHPFAENGDLGKVYALDEQGHPCAATKQGYGGAGPSEGACWPWASARPGADAKQKMVVTPIKEGTAFLFHVDFDNLAQEELDLLCYVLRPNAAFRHKLGLGKPIGLGSVCIEPIGVFLVTRQDRYLKDEPLSSGRYHRIWCAAGIEFTDRYRHEGGAISGLVEHRDRFDETLAPSTPSDRFREAHTEVCAVIEKLGRPANVQHPVHYPQVSGVVEYGGKFSPKTGWPTACTAVDPAPTLESETYLWFVANDDENRKRQLNRPAQGLAPLKPSQGPLPKLTRPIYHRKKV